MVKKGTYEILNGCRKRKKKVQVYKISMLYL